MTYARLPNIGRLQKVNATAINKALSAGDPNVAVARGEDLELDSPIEQILYDWAENVTKQLNQSWVEHGFNPASNSGKFEPNVIDKSGVLKVLTLTPANNSDAWFWAETGRGKSRKKGAVPLWKILEEWITYRGINVRDVTKWQRKKDGKTFKPYKNISDTLKLRSIMAHSFAHSIHQKGTIKRFNYKGSKWFTSVVNNEALKDLSENLSTALGYQISVKIANEL